MGTSGSVPQFVAKLDRAGKALADTRKPLTATAAHAKMLFLASAAEVGVGKGKGRSKVSAGVFARYTVDGAGQQASATVRYTGPAHLVNNPTKPHEIRPRAFVGTRGSGTRAQKGAALMAAFGLDARNRALGGGVVTVAGHPVSVIHHPGTKGLGFAQRAKAVCAVQCPKVYQRVGVTDPLRSVFQ